MGRVYRTQNALRIIADTDVNLTSVLDQRIKYVDPDGTTGSYAASVLSVTGGTIYFDLVATLGVDGNRKFWSWVKFSDGRTAPGKTDRHRIFREGE